MKRILYNIIMAAAVLFLAVGCQKESERVKEMLVGDWHYSGTEQGVAEDVWLCFSADGTFDMYQKLGDGVHWHSTGRYTIDVDKKVISGSYSDKTPWRYDYKYSLSGSSLVMKAVQLESYSVSYSKGTVPSEVLETALELTKASTGFVPFL